MRRADSIRKGDTLNGRTVVSVHVTRHNAIVRTDDGHLARYFRGQPVEAVAK